MRKLVLSGVLVWCRALFVAAGLLVSMASLLFTSAPAFGAFTRPFLGELKGTTGLSGELVPFEGVEGIAIENHDGGNVFIGNTGMADEFTSSNVFEPPAVTGLSTFSLAFDDVSGKLVGVGKEEWVAADDSSNPGDSAVGDVYRAVHEGPPGYLGRVSRTKSGGEADPFTCPEGVSAGYINGAGELIGEPGEVWDEFRGPRVQGLAVDSSEGASGGDFYVINQVHLQVDQFTSAGCFVRAIKDVPGERGGSELESVAVDPATGDVLVAVFVNHPGEGSSFIDEFTSSGAYLGQIAGVSRGVGFGEDAFGGPGFRVPGLGMAVSSAGDLYVDDDESRVVYEFGLGAFYPRVVTGGVTGDQPEMMTLNGTVNDEDEPLTECYFEYVEAARYVSSASDPYAAGERAECVPGVGGVSAGKEDVAVHAEAVHLVSGRFYDYRLVATTDPSDRGGTEDGEDGSFVAAAAPSVEDVSVGDVSSSFADFSARINPMGVDTTYEFQYVDAAQYESGASDPYAAGGSVPVSAGIGLGDRGVGVSVLVGGLSPGTVYDYRVVASNGVGVTEGANEVFSTVGAGSQVLPDGRVYELVTPANKGDAEDMFGGLEIGVEVNHEYGYSSEDGDHFLLWASAAFGPFPASGENAYVFSRGWDGWSFRSVASSSLGVQAVTDLVFDPFDLSMVGVGDDLGVENERNAGLVGPSGGPYASIGSTVGASEAISPVGASGDLSRVVAESEDHKLPLCEASQEGLAEKLDAGSHGLYEWSAARQCLAFVDMTSGSEGGELLSKCGAVLGQGTVDTRPGSTRGAVSGDGSKIFFTAPDPTAEGSHCWKEGAGDNDLYAPQIYMREVSEEASGVPVYKTVEVSAAEGGATPRYPAVFVGASEDGSKVFFATRSELTKEAVELKTHELELYEYDTEAPEGERLIWVSRGDLESGPVEGEVLDVPAVSADGSTVYFNDKGDLTLGASEGGLYRYDTDTGQTAYVAPVQGYATEKSGRIGEPKENIESPWYHRETIDGLVLGLDLEAEYETTRDGGFLLFGAYRYDAADGSTVCVMCNPNGSGLMPDTGFGRSAAYNGNPAGRPPRAMSENGEYVFFDTPESLVPQDTNAKVDLYEWHDGTISLISSGQDPSGSYFLDSSSFVNSEGQPVEGGNVFFGTHAQLVPQDIDEEGDLYDARIGGGFPAPTGPRPCEGDACDNPPSPPIYQMPATSTSSSTGNVASQPVSKVKAKGEPKKPKKSGKEKGKGKGKKARAKHAARRARRARNAGLSEGARR
jgi:hypothetical protein